MVSFFAFDLPRWPVLKNNCKDFSISAAAKGGIIMSESSVLKLDGIQDVAKTDIQEPIQREQTISLLKMHIMALLITPCYCKETTKKSKH